MLNKSFLRGERATDPGAGACQRPVGVIRPPLVPLKNTRNKFFLSGSRDLQTVTFQPTTRVILSWRSEVTSVMFNRMKRVETLKVRGHRGCDIMVFSSRSAATRSTERRVGHFLLLLPQFQLLMTTAA